MRKIDNELDVIGRGKLSWLAEEILTEYSLNFFDDTMDEYQNTDMSTSKNVFISIGDPLVRKTLYELYKDRNHISVISKLSHVSKRAKIAPGAFINNFSSIHTHATLGLACFVHPNTVIDVGVKVGDFCRFGSNVHVAEYASVGNECIVGSGAVIIPRVSIGNNCEVCAGTVVTKSFGDNEILAGVPARSIRSKS